MSIAITSGSLQPGRTAAEANTSAAVTLAAHAGVECVSADDAVSGGACSPGGGLILHPDVLPVTPPAAELVVGGAGSDVGTVGASKGRRDVVPPAQTVGDETSGPGRLRVGVAAATVKAAGSKTEQRHGAEMHTSARDGALASTAGAPGSRSLSQLQVQPVMDTAGSAGDGTLPAVLQPPPAVVRTSQLVVLTNAGLSPLASLGNTGRRRDRGLAHSSPVSSRTPRAHAETAPTAGEPMSPS